MKKAYSGTVTITVEDILALANVAHIRVINTKTGEIETATRGYQIRYIAEEHCEDEVKEIQSNVKDERSGYHWFDIYI